MKLSHVGWNRMLSSLNWGVGRQSTSHTWYVSAFHFDHSYFKRLVWTLIFHWEINGGFFLSLCVSFIPLLIRLLNDISVILRSYYLTNIITLLFIYKCILLFSFILLVEECLSSHSENLQINTHFRSEKFLIFFFLFKINIGAHDIETNHPENSL